MELFAEKGFDATTITDIAKAAGIARRTFFRYFASKNDIPWGDAGPVLEALGVWLAAVPDDVPTLEAILGASLEVVAPAPEKMATHRQRMLLIHGIPALQAHRALHSAEMQKVFARFAADRMGVGPAALGPRTIGHVVVGAMQAAYDAWLEVPDADLRPILREAFALIRLEEPAPAKPAASKRRSPRTARDSTAKIGSYSA